VTRIRAAIVPLALVGLVALAGVVLGRIYADALLTQLVTGAAVGSVAIGVAMRRRPSWTVAPLSVLLLAGYTVLSLRLAANHADLPGPLAHILADATTNGIPRLLTAMIPIESTPDTVVVPVATAWLAGLAATEIAIRGGRVLLGCLPPVALYTGALYVVGPNASAAGIPTFAFAAMVASALATAAHPSRGLGLVVALSPLEDRFVPTTTPGSWEVERALRTRKVIEATAGLIVVAGLVALAAPWVGGRVSATPLDPRRYVQPPQVDSLDESPLNRISGWALAPEQRLLEVHWDPPAAKQRESPTGSKASAASKPGSGAGSKASAASKQPGPATGPYAPAPWKRLRLAVLPDYDGVTWRVGAVYRNAGRVLPRQPELPDVSVTAAREHITVDGLTGRLLPALPVPTGVEGARVAFDAGTGTLIRPEGLTAGLTYTVSSDVPTPDLNLLPAAEAPSGDAVARFLAVGAGVPEPIQRLADELAEGNGGAFDRATAIEEFLAEHYKKVPDAPSGHAYPNLQFFLFGPRDQGGQRGTSEQFAASFALLARLTGLPSRVAVGFDVPAGGTVTAADAIAWPEVLFTELGWVPFDPMPKSDDARPIEDDFTPQPSTPPPTTTEAPPPSDDPRASASQAALAKTPGAGPSAAVVTGGASGAAVLILAAAGFALVLSRRALRRRRLTRGDPDERITGAWYEFTDALRLAGRPVPPHLAATEAAEFAATVTAAPRASAHAAASHSANLPPATASGGNAPDIETPASNARIEPRIQTRPAVPRSAASANTGSPQPLLSLDDLVTAVNTAAFAPGHSDAEQADRAGAQAVAYADALRAQRSWWRRLLWSLHPGPFRWHRPRRVRADE
jgi:transglutaminase-like putative cysteine protease